jgi:hypothetical protein
MQNKEIEYENEFAITQILLDNGMTKEETSQILEKTHVSAIINFLGNQESTNDDMTKEVDDEYQHLRSIVAPSHNNTTGEIKTFTLDSVYPQIGGYGRF